MTSRSREEGKKYVLNMVKENGVKFITLWFADILGFLKSFTITVEELEGALEDGMGFDGSSIEGFARIDESDMGTARPRYLPVAALATTRAPCCSPNVLRYFKAWRRALRG